MTFTRVGRPWGWLGSKATLASDIGVKFLPYLDNKSKYYEGFGGTASVGIWIGHYRDCEIEITETNPHAVNALNYIKKGADATAITSRMARWVDVFQNQSLRIDEISRGSQDDDPVNFIAAMNSTRPSRGNYPYMQDDVLRRMKDIAYDMEYVKHGLRNATIRCEPMSLRECTAAYFDPPYFGSSLKYPYQQGEGLHNWLMEMLKFKYIAKFIAISDSNKAEQYYTNCGFTHELTRKRLAVMLRSYEAGEHDCLYWWDQTISSPE